MFDRRYIVLNLENNELNYLPKEFLEEIVLRRGITVEMSGNPISCKCFDSVREWRSKHIPKNFQLEQIVFGKVDEGLKGCTNSNNFPICIVDFENPEKCDMTEKPSLTERYKYAVLQYENQFCRININNSPADWYENTFT